MTNLKHTNTLFSLALTVLFLYSCGGSGKKIAEAEKAKAFSEAESKIMGEIDKVVHELPPPS